jgi:signal transduction histidine kinase
MSSQVPRSRPGALEQRWPPVATVLPYAMLAFCVLLDVSIDGKAGVHKTTAGLLIYLVILAVNIAIACGLSWALWVSQERENQREQALGELSEANRRLEATLAENAGLQQQLLTQVREAGVLDERQRMAREIHDTLAQGLTGIITQLQAAEHASDDPAGWRRHFDAATRLARDSLSEARRSVQALCPEPLETARLSDAVADVAAAARLFITEATVKTHLLNIYAKLGVGDRAAAVAEAFNRGLFTPGTTERT